MKNGFTLVELSIVLVVIGLLIGGILVGQSLIESSRIQRILSQISQVESAVNSFKSKFRQLPGDSSLLDNPGNNDSYIEPNGCGAASGGICYNGEASNFWPHLSVSGCDPSTQYTSTITTYYTNSDTIKNGPRIANSDLTMIASAIVAPTSEIISENLFLLGNLQHIDSNNAGTVCAVMNANITTGDCAYTADSYVQPSFTPVNAMAIDSKIDDGVYNTGKVRGGYPSDLSLGNCYAGGALGDSASTPQCILFFFSDNLKK